MNKRELKISLSSTFLVKSKCKYCLGGPTFFFSSRKEKLFKSPRLACKRQEFDLLNYPIIMSKYDNSIIIYREFYLSYHSIDGKLHSRFNVKMFKNKNITNKLNLSETIYCRCSKTKWEFNSISVKNRKEIFNRKSDKKYPQTFIY